MTRKPAIGAKVVAARDVWDPWARVLIPQGTPGVVVAAGADAAYGMVNITFDHPGATAGLPTFVAGRDAAAELVP